jgi:hypothetical protein
VPRKRRAPTWPVEWFCPIICGTPWRVVFGRPEDLADLKDDDGCTIYATSTIWIASRFAGQPERCAEIAFHELDHAIGEMSGGRHVIFGADSDREENAIRIYSPARYAALAASGLLTLPPVPPLPPQHT